MKPYIIAIDGPAGSGKSTIAQLIAKNLNFLYIDSGAMYRAVTLYLIKKKLLKLPDKKLKQHLKNLKISFFKKAGKQLVYLNNKDVSKKIRSTEVSKLVSEVSAKKIVREELVKRQQQFGFNNSIVMDGRDIGTAVFKDANLKIYLTASSYIRAKRRRKDLEQIAEKVDLKKLIKQIQDRDNYDSSRDMSPLCKPQDAIVIDSTKLSINQVLERINYFLPF